MILDKILILGALLLVSSSASSAPICVLNQSGKSLVLVVDDLNQTRKTERVETNERLCIPSRKSSQKAVVGVFADFDTLEGCSRLTRPGQTETLLEFAEFDNCRWQVTDRNFD